MKLHYERLNNGHDACILLLHGFLSDSQSMSSIGQALSDHFDIIYIDLPGFGRTTSVNHSYKMDDITYEIYNVLKNFSYADYHLLGYSMGGRVSISMLVNDPEFFQSAILISTSPGILDEDEREQRIALDAQRAHKIESDFDQFIKEWEALPLFESQKKLQPLLFEQQKLWRLNQNPKEAANSLTQYGTGVQPYYGDRLHHIHTNVMCVVGEKDQKFVTINKNMVKLFKHGTLRIVQDAGHNVMLERQKFFNQMAINYFLGVSK